jgi:glycerol-3-phosphate acyltransferase PlsY
MIIAYLLGSIPFALIIGKLVIGIDIREHGSRNMGATNAVRVLGIKWGIIVFALDMLKAGLIIALFRFNIISFQEHNLVHPLVYGAIAILGHLFPVFAQFHGGKGVACTAGIILVYQPLIFLIGLCIFIIIVVSTKYVSLGSLFSAFACLILSIIIPNRKVFSGPLFTNGRFDYWLIGFLFIVTIIIIISHRHNIKRLLSKTESKITDREKLL